MVKLLLNRSDCLCIKINKSNPPLIVVNFMYHCQEMMNAKIVWIILDQWPGLVTLHVKGRIVLIPSSNESKQLGQPASHKKLVICSFICIYDIKCKQLIVANINRHWFFYFSHWECMGFGHCRINSLPLQAKQSSL